ncbi:MAG: ATP synthase F1 subunit gamma [Oscillospiraceae bacterium]|nr:ATP synthase F1 subunit gamma [Bacteroidales bacterium]MDD6998748.1 ATP synthase F1 subunit gamma [Oscillospiraceae bacterium]MDY5096180.1 ATP synthase F1 subunit gamma [Oscillospiraceae bacterium]
MAGSMKDIKLRIRSVQSTMQITKAMELVASSKLRHARERMEQARPYFETLQATLADIAAANTEFTSPYLARRPVKKTCYIVIAGDRGLAGGYNANLFKLVAQAAEGKECCVLPVGKKALEHFQRRGMSILTEAFSPVEDVTVSDCFSMSRLVAQGFLKGEFDEIHLCYTRFESMLTQTAKTVQMLPMAAPKPREDKRPRSLMLYEPSSEAVYDAIVPEYFAGLIWGAVCESEASEQAARRTAMDAASKNAGEMIENLNLRYNRARQAAITQEITEIVAGAEQ